MPESIFLNKTAGLRTATLLKKGPWHRCFPVNFAKGGENLTSIDLWNKEEYDLVVTSKINLRRGLELEGRNLLEANSNSNRWKVRVLKHFSP